MSISSEHKRRKRTVTDTDGNHIPVSEWTHADSVQLSNGLTLDESVVYLTQAEYDALGDEKYTNNVEYRITDGSTEIHDSVVGVKGGAESAYRDGEVNITAENIGLGNVPNVATNDQTPTYEVAETNTELTSGEKLNVAFGKIAKVVSSVISHLADTVSHITSAERTKWDGYETVIATNTTNIATNANAITQLNSDIAEIKTVEKFSIISPSTTGVFTLGRQNCYKVGNRVHIEYNVQATQDIAIDTSWGMIPIAYAPTSNTGYIGLLCLEVESSTDTITPFICGCSVTSPNTNGTAYGLIFQNIATNVKAGCEVSFMFDYYI